jgi:hypothetical protein
MTEGELGNALVRGEDPIDVQKLTERVLRADRRRLWGVGLVCVAAWMLAVAIPWGTLLPMIAKVTEQQAQINRQTGEGAAGQRELADAMTQVIKQGTVLTFVGSMGTMLVASICTVAFIVLTRRATLRQINARLAEISAQIRAMSAERK